MEFFSLSFFSKSYSPHVCIRIAFCSCLIRLFTKGEQVKIGHESFSPLLLSVLVHRKHVKKDASKQPQTPRKDEEEPESDNDDEESSPLLGEDNKLK